MVMFVKQRTVLCMMSERLVATRAILGQGVAKTAHGGDAFIQFSDLRPEDCAYGRAVSAVTPPEKQTDLG